MQDKPKRQTPVHARQIHVRAHHTHNKNSSVSTSTATRRQPTRRLAVWQQVAASLQCTSKKTPGLICNLQQLTVRTLPTPSMGWEVASSGRPQIPPHSCGRCGSFHLTSLPPHDEHIGRLLWILSPHVPAGSGHHTAPAADHGCNPRHRHRASKRTYRLRTSIVRTKIRGAP